MRKTIAHITDTHLGQKVPSLAQVNAGYMQYQRNPDEHKTNLKAILDDVTERGINEIVFGGDIGWKEMNPWFFDLIKTYDLKMSLVLGNHDTYQEVRKYYSTDLAGSHSELYYTHEDDHLKYIYLDSSCGAISSAQFNWLQQSLNTEKKILLFIHHPVLPVNTPVDRMGPLRDREKIREVLQAVKNEITIFCGHCHMIDEAVDSNIHQFVTPAVSYRIVKEVDTIVPDTETFGYRIIEISNTEINTSIVLL